MPELKRQILDVNVEISFKRKYKGKQRKDTEIFRLVAILNEETGKYHTYITNIPSDVLSLKTLQSYMVRDGTSN